MITVWMKKYKSLILYGIFGGLTTVLNIGIYLICTRFFMWGTVFSNIFAWIGGVVFAYITNRRYVFESEENSMQGIFREFISFVSCRLITGGIDLLIMFVFVELCDFNDVFIKVSANIIVIILNYIGSKVIVFQTQKNNRYD